MGPLDKLRIEGARVLGRLAGTILAAVMHTVAARAFGVLIRLVVSLSIGAPATIIVLLCHGYLLYKLSLVQNFTRAVLAEMMRDGPAGLETVEAMTLAPSIFLYFITSIFCYRPLGITRGILWTIYRIISSTELLIITMYMNLEMVRELRHYLLILVGLTLKGIRGATRGLRSRVFRYRNQMASRILNERLDLGQCPQYAYTQLKAPGYIRLLRLIPSLTSIGCDLVHVHLEQAPRYEAISYTWGNPAKTHGLAINGQRLPITTNVHEILHDRISMRRIMFLWIDSICINQDDVEEKNSQVQLMRDIFHRASRAVVCLGNSPSADTAHKFLDQLLFDLAYRKDADLSARRDFDERNPKFSALRTLLNHPFWSRVWVVQEIAVAKTVHLLYGGKYIDWDLFVSIMREFMSTEKGSLLQILDTVEGGATVPFYGISQVCKLGSTRESLAQKKVPTLPQMLVDFASCKATDQRDMVFALQGITSAVEDRALLPDYNQSLRGVYLETALYALKSAKPFSLFPMAGFASITRMDDLPSWVPDWTKSPGMYPLKDLAGGKPEYRAAGDSKANIRLSSRPGEIELEGILVDRILCVADILPSMTPVRLEDPDFIYADFLTESGSTEESRHKEARALANDFAPERYFNGQSRAEALWRTVICDASMSAYPAEDTFGEAYQYWLRVTAASPIVFSKDWNEGKFDPASVGAALLALSNPSQEVLDILAKMTPGREPSAEEMLAILAVVQGFRETEQRNTSTRFGLLLGQTFNVRQFAVTSKGYMTLVPPGTRADDVICIFLGSPTPFVLRPDHAERRDGAQGSAARSYHQLVGEAYVHGMMNGEALQGDAERQFFHLR